MKKIISFIVTSLFIFSASIAQKKLNDQIKAKDTVLIRLQHQCHQAENDSIKFQALLKLSYYQVNRDIERTINALDKAILIYESGQYKLDPISLGYVYEVYASAYRHQGKYTESLQFFHKAKNMYPQLNHSIDIARINHSISVLYTSIGDEEKSLEYVKKAILINQKINNKKGLAFNYNKIGNTFRAQKNRDSALYYFEKAKDYFLDVNLKEGWYRANTHIGKILESDGDYQESLNYYLENFENKTKLGYNQGIILSSLDISRVYTKLKKYKKAEEFVEIGLSIAKKDGVLNLISRAYLQKTEVYKSAGRFKEAIINKELYHIYKDSVLNIDNVKKIQELELTHAFRKEKVRDSMQLVKEKEIAETNAQLLQTESKIKSQWMLFGGIGLLGVFVIIYLIRSQKFTKKQQELQESFSQELINEQEKERSRLARDLHDSVGQKLMLLSKQTKKMDNPNIENLASSTLEEIRSISRGLHPSNLERLGLTEAINVLIYDINANTELFFTEEIENIDNILSKEAELHLYRIIQESLSNIVKHAEAKAVKLAIQQKEKTTEIIISDNGKGFDFESKYKNMSLGLKTLFERAKIINAQMNLETSLGKGTIINLSIPITNG